MRRPWLAAVIMLTSAGAAPAVVVLDQQYDPTLSHIAAVTNEPNYVDEDKAQTFTVGVTGLLTTVEVRIGRGGGASGDLRLDIRPTLSGVPLGDGTELVTATIPESDAPNTFPNYTWAVVTGLSVPVVSGQQLAIVLQNMGFNFYGWGAALTGYGGGGGYTRSINGPWNSEGEFDWAFRTYVTIVPEAGSFLLLGSVTAAGGLLAAYRKHRG